MDNEMLDKLHPGSSDEQPPQEQLEPEEASDEADSPEETQEVDEEQEEQIGEEFLDLNNQMDQISTFLDDLEQKNDNLQAKLRQLLAMTKEERLAALADQINMSEEPGNEAS